MKIEFCRVCEYGTCYEINNDMIVNHVGLFRNYESILRDFLAHLSFAQGELL